MRIKTFEFDVTVDTEEIDKEINNYLKGKKLVNLVINHFTRTTSHEFTSQQFLFEGFRYTVITTKE